MVSYNDKNNTYKNQHLNKRILNMFHTIHLEIINTCWFQKDNQAWCILEIEGVVVNILKIIVRLFKTIGIYAIYYCQDE
ncbi:hypothetical protein [Candidatus Karelsulcia muelleri]